MRNVDDAWKYEPRLPKAIAALDDRTVPLDGHTWAEVLVPFISSLFIRGPEFGSYPASSTKTTRTAVV
jgi:hypothetical protein